MQNSQNENNMYVTYDVFVFLLLSVLLLFDDSGSAGQMHS